MPFHVSLALSHPVDDWHLCEVEEDLVIHSYHKLVPDGVFASIGDCSTVGKSGNNDFETM